MMLPTWQSEGVKLYHGDCRKLLLWLRSIDSIVSDPPYGIALENHAFGKERSPRSFSVVGDHSQDAGLFVLKWAEAKELPLVFFASPWKPWPGKYRNLIVWDKGGRVGGGGDTKTCLKRCWELIQVARNKSMNGPRDSAVWRHPQVMTTTADHVCAKPLDLMVRLIARFTKPGDTVLDPFMGSGTTGAACVQTGRRFVGVEISEKYFRVAKERIERAIEHANCA